MLSRLHDPAEPEVTDKIRNFFAPAGLLPVARCLAAYPYRPGRGCLPTPLPFGDPGHGIASGRTLITCRR
jgi:hypothetical protein